MYQFHEYIMRTTRCAAGKNSAKRGAGASDVWISLHTYFARNQSTTKTENATLTLKHKIQDGSTNVG